MNLIPEELKAVRQWTYSFSEEEKKRPTYTKYKAEGALKYEDALKYKRQVVPAGYIGFYVTTTDPYVLVDVDHLINPMEPWPELPVDMASFIRSHDSYSEVSPSGRGLRIVYKLSDYTVKSNLTGSYFKYKEDMGIGSEEKPREAQINFGPPWQTITGNATPFAVDRVAEVSLKDLMEIFPVKLKELKPESKQPRNVTQRLPAFSEVLEAIRSIPLDQNPRIQRAYKQVFGTTYQHYEFWIKVLMALHNYAELSNKVFECMEVAVEWSRKDTTDFESEEDVIKHWRSFSEDKDRETVSYKTLFGLAYRFRLFWPVPKKRTKEEKAAGLPPKPLVSEYVNFKSMLDYYDIALHRDETDTNVVYVTGDRDIIEEYFMMHLVRCYYGKYWGPFTRDTLIPAFHIMCQAKGFVGISHQVVSGFVKNWFATTRSTVNLVKQYFDTPHDKLPAEYQTPPAWRETTTFEALFDCIVVDYVTEEEDQERELYKAYYKKWLMGIIRSLYYPDAPQMNNCVLLLTGREQIRKTSHFLFLLPKFMRDKIAMTTHGFATETAMRDVVKLSATNLILVWDELEQFLVTGTESNFKKIIDGNPQKIIDKYETIEKTIKPIAIYGATSNQREFNLGSEGSRRIFHIPVKWVHTGKMEKLCWHKIVNELHAEVEWLLKTGSTPWLLTQEQLAYQSDLHKGIRSKTSVDIMLNEVWDFDTELNINSSIPFAKSIQTDKTGRLLTTTEVKNMLARAGHIIPNLPALVRSLERMCGTYTKTIHQKKQVERPACVVFKGLAVQHQYKKWVMPPLRKEAATDMFRQFKNGMT